MPKYKQVTGSPTTRECDRENEVNNYDDLLTITQFYVDTGWVSSAIQCECACVFVCSYTITPYFSEINFWGKYFTNQFVFIYFKFFLWRGKV